MKIQKLSLVSGSENKRMTQKLAPQKFNCFYIRYCLKTKHKPTEKLQKHVSPVKWKLHVKNQLVFGTRKKKTPKNATDVHYFALEAEFTIVVPIVSPSYEICPFLFFLQTPGPGTYKVIDPNIYRNRKPIFSMNARNYAPGDSTLKPGPGAHRPELVR